MSTTHTPTPYTTDEELLCDEHGNILAEFEGERTSSDEDMGNAAFAKTACNSHAALVEALEATVTSIEVLLEAWHDDHPTVPCGNVSCGHCKALKTARELLATAKEADNA